VSGLVADDGAIALQRADREDFVDHAIIVARGVAGGRQSPLLAKDARNGGTPRPLVARGFRRPLRQAQGRLYRTRLQLSAPYPPVNWRAIVSCPHGRRGGQSRLLL
jgi:hypothetical protein